MKGKPHSIDFNTYSLQQTEIFKFALHGQPNTAKLFSSREVIGQQELQKYEIENWFKNPSPSFN